MMDQFSQTPASPDHEKNRGGRPIRPFSHPLTHLAAWALMCLLVAGWMALSWLEQSIQEEMEETPSVGLEEELNGDTDLPCSGT